MSSRTIDEDMAYIAQTLRDAASYSRALKTSLQRVADEVEAFRGTQAYHADPKALETFLDTITAIATSYEGSHG